MYFNIRLRTVVWVVSILAGVIIILYPMFIGQYFPKQPYFIPLEQQVNNYFAAGFLVALALPAIVEYSNYHHIKRIETAVPRILRDIAESVRSGVTLTRAVEQTAEKDYGPLSKEIERVIGLFVVGVSWEEAVVSLGKRIKSPSVLRLSTILIEANQSGGKTSAVLEASVDLFSSVEQYKEEQQNNMKPYLYTIYASIVVFLIISFVIITQFLGPLAKSITTPISMKGTSISVLDLNYYVSILFWASFVESFFGGIIAGKIGDRAYLTGLRHSILLVTLSTVCFNLMVGLL
jgi:archaeal flagellar protein FlaJ